MPSFSPPTVTWAKKIRASPIVGGAVAPVHLFHALLRSKSSNPAFERDWPYAVSLRPVVYQHSWLRPSPVRPAPQFER